MFSRIIRVSSLSSHYASLRAKSTKPIPIITKYPVRIGIKYPSWDVPAFIEFDSKKHIKTFFSERKQFLMDPRTGNCILPDETHRIDPSVTYDIVGTDLSYHHEKSLSPDQVWDRIFEGKTTRALRDWFISEGVKFAELPRVVKDPGTGLDVEEWELIIQILSDGTLVFLETKYRMWKKHIDTQSLRISKTLAAMGKDSGSTKVKLYLAAYTWPEKDGLISYAQGLGYGVILPNEADLTIHTKAKELTL